MAQVESLRLNRRRDVVLHWRVLRQDRIDNAFEQPLRFCSVFLVFTVNLLLQQIQTPQRVSCHVTFNCDVAQRFHLGRLLVGGAHVVVMLHGLGTFPIWLALWDPIWDELGHWGGSTVSANSLGLRSTGVWRILQVEFLNVFFDLCLLFKLIQKSLLLGLVLRALDLVHLLLQLESVEIFCVFALLKSIFCDVLEGI